MYQNIVYLNKHDPDLYLDYIISDFNIFQLWEQIDLIWFSHLFLKMTKFKTSHLLFKLYLVFLFKLLDYLPFRN